MTATWVISVVYQSMDAIIADLTRAAMIFMWRD